LLLALLFFSLFTSEFLGKVPTTEELISIKTPNASEVFSDDGKLLGRYYMENRSSVRFDEISPKRD
jgi:penicillin-binding protein 1A